VDPFALLIVLIVATVASWIALNSWFRPHIVREYERGVLFRRGKLQKELTPGRYWLRRYSDELVIVDVRRRFAVVAGQEVLTSDRVPLKVSLIADYSVSNATKAVVTVEQYHQALYSRLQLALREAVAGKDLDAALAERGDLGATILGTVRADAPDYGIEVHAVQVRDFMMAANLRTAYADVLLARQQGLAALERARGESAAARNMANAALVMEKHPGIMQLRLLQAIESGTGNRVVIALDSERAKSLAVGEAEADA
jgi:regulator of protease activity HflC (stomatin/prohibitin superfamily)